MMYFATPHLVFLVAISMGVAYAACPVYTQKSGNSCYFFSYVKKSWTSAMTACHRMGSRLAIVEDKAEDNFLIGVAQKRKVNFWLDGTDKADEGTWLWSTTLEKMAYTNWDTEDGEPDNKQGGQDCLAIYKKNGRYRWYDVKCSDSFYYICESKDTEQDADLKCAKDLLDELMKCNQTLAAGCK